MSERGLIVTGATGFVGGYLLQSVAASRITGVGRGDPPDGWDGPWVRWDPLDAEAASRAVADAAPDVVIHLAAMTDLESCDADPQQSEVANVALTAALADACRATGARLLLASTEQVFDGDHPPYTEGDPVGPVHQYGQTKVAAEREVAARWPGALVVRLPLILGFGLAGARSFCGNLRDALRAGEGVVFYADEVRSACDVFTVRDALLELADSAHTGILHVAGVRGESRSAIGRELLARLGAPQEAAEHRTSDQAGPERSKRPRDVSLDVSRAQDLLATPLPTLTGSFDRIWADTDPTLLRL